MEKQTVHLYVFDSLSDWEPGYAIAGLNTPDFQIRPGRFTVQTVGTSLEPVRTAGGLTILPDMRLADLDPGRSAMLILPGGAGWESGRHAEAAEKARTFLKDGVPVAAICGATAGLALLGLLDHRPHTSNALAYLKALGYRGEAFYQDQPAVTDDTLITASATAAVDFAFHIFKRLYVYPPAMLQAWYGLYKTGDKEHFFAMQKLAEEGKK